MANIAFVVKLKTPTMTANVRKIRCRHRNRSPSAISARMVDRRSRSIRKDPGTRSSAPSATTHNPAGVTNAAVAPAATSRPAKGGPANWLAVSSAAYRRALARDSWSRPTSCGKIDCAEVSYSVSAVPTQTATMYRAQIEPACSTTASTSTASSAARTRFAPSIARRRSSRSASAPAGSANSSQGSVKAKTRPAISAGDRVKPMATSGRATLTIPSARSDRTAEVHSRQ
jgi:hypothetical protein